MLVIMYLISFVVNFLIITFIVDVILMGMIYLHIRFENVSGEYVITKPNRIDIQTGMQCAGYSSAYVLRHFDMYTSGLECYEQLPNKMKGGQVYPKGITKFLRSKGFDVKYCVGNISALKAEVQKGTPVIIMIRTGVGQNYLHVLPVVGFDEENIFCAESLQSFVNCNEVHYNRKIDIPTFKKLWNTSMLKMPFYMNTFFIVKPKKNQSNKNENIKRS